MMFQVTSSNLLVRMWFHDADNVYKEKFIQDYETYNEQEREDRILFIKDHDNDLERLISAADFLECRELYNACIIYLRFLLTTLTPEAIRNRFQLSNDLTEEQKKEVQCIGSYILHVRL